MAFRLLRPLICLLLIFCSAVAFAWPPTFGPEFEFGSRQLSGWYALKDFFYGRFGNGFKLTRELQVRRQMLDEVLRLCNGCTQTQVPSKREYIDDIRITWPDGKWIQLTVDPQVIEVTMMPMTLEELRANAEEMQRSIFQAAKNVGLAPYGSNNFFNRSAGHFNIGAHSSFADGRELLAFMADYANFPELSLGVLGRDPMNASSLSEGPQKLRDFFASVIKDVNKLTRYRIDTPHDYPTGKLWQYFMKNWKHFRWFGRLLDFPNYHNQALSIEGMQDSFLRQRIELRAVRMQESFEDFVRLAELMQARIEFVNKRVKSHPILYENSSRTRFSPTQLVSRFYVYVAETGLDFERYKTLMFRELHSVEPDLFVRGIYRWEDPQFVEAFKEHILGMKHSAWLRNRAAEALAAAGERDARAVRKIRKLMEQHGVSDLVDAPPAPRLKAVPLMSCERVLAM